MGLYVLVMRGANGLPDEIRYSDRPLNVGSRLRVNSRGWVVTDVENTEGRLVDPSGAPVIARYICTRADRIAGADRPAR